MKELITAFKIFSKYLDVVYPTSCKEGELVVNIHPYEVSNSDRQLLAECNFYPGQDQKTFVSYRFGGHW